MERIRQDAIKIYNESMLDIKETKSMFCKIIKTINSDMELKSLFTQEMTTHLNHLVEMWRNNDDANIEFYFKLKEHHTYINGKIEHTPFKNIWEQYISQCCRLRCKLIILNDLCLKLPAFKATI